MRDSSQEAASAATWPLMMPLAIRLLACTERGALAVIRPARASASSTTPARGTTRLTRPSSRARSAVIGSPVRIISIATFFGICFGSRKTPPAPA